MIGADIEWMIRIDEERRYAEVVTGGIADKGGTLEMAKAIAIALSSNEIKKILVDHGNIDSVSGDTTDVFSRPKQFQQIGIIHGIKIAEVIKPEHKEFFKFFETVCVNRGYSFSIFSDKESAMEWLLKT